MRIVFCLFFLFITVCQPIYSQSLSKMGTIAFLNSRAKEAIGSLRIFNADSRTVIEDGGFSESDMGVNIRVKLSSVGKEDATINSEFDPAHIQLVEIVQVDKKSPVGQVKITLTDPTKKSTSLSKSSGLEVIYEELVYFNYLKIDKANDERVRQAFWDLKNIYSTKTIQSIEQLSQMIPIYKNFWISKEGGTSITYRVDKMYAYGGVLRFFYKQETVTKYGDDTKFSLIEIPLNAIGSIDRTNKNSRPNCVILKAAKKKGFDVFEYSKFKENEIYKNRTTIKEFPLLIDIGYPEKYKEVTELLKQLVKDYGGKKIKT